MNDAHARGRAAAEGMVLPDPAAAPESFVLQPGEVRTVVRHAAPRLVRDGFGPLACFFAGWKLFGLTYGIVLAAVFGAAAFVHERRQGRPGMIVRLALILVAIRAVVGLSSGSATVYLAQEVFIDALLGGATLASIALGRPFAALFASEVYPQAEQVRESALFQETMRTITLVWGVYFLARGLVRVLALLTLSTNAYLLVAAAIDAPFLVGLLAWSVYYAAGALARDPSATALAAAPAPVPPEP
jgi:hypothetical protein